MLTEEVYPVLEEKNRRQLNAVQQLNRLTHKVVTLHSLGTFFSEDSELSFPGCVIIDYTDACLALIEEIQRSLSPPVPPSACCEAAPPFGGIRGNSHDIA
jgi:hypothetical protein